jgi:hypothetical protein
MQRRSDFFAPSVTKFLGRIKAFTANHRQNRAPLDVISTWDVALPCKGMLEEPPQRELRTDLVKSEVPEKHFIAKSKISRLVLQLTEV